MNEIEVFKFNEKEVRVEESQGETWFCLKDVCDILEIKNHKDVVSRLNQKGVDYTDTLTKGGMQKMVFINESNLYKVVFQSRKPQAEAFTEYVTGTILPTIRKHGAYMTEQTLEEALTNPDFLIRLATELKEEKQKRKELEVKNSELVIDNQEMKLKAVYFDNLVDHHLLTNFRDTAKEFKIKQNDFIKYLSEKKYIYRDAKGKLKPYAQYVDNGLFELKEYKSRYNDHVDVQTLITPKGRETFRLLLEQFNNC